MNITVIGASAGIGLEVVKTALQRKHKVTTLSRSEIALPDHSNLTKLEGSAVNRDDLKKSLDYAQAVIVALGTGMDRKPTTLYSDFARLLVELHRENRSKIPVIVVTGFGAGASGAYNSFLMRMLFKFLLKAVYADKSEMERIIANSTMNWEIVRPGRLTDGAFTSKYRTVTDLYKGMAIGSINRSDVADFLVKQAENPTELYKYPALSNS